MTFFRKYDKIEPQKGKVNTMLHSYEIQRFDNDGTTHIVDWFVEEPKVAKQKLKKYAEENPGIYSLYQVKRVGSCFTVKEDQHD